MFEIPYIQISIQDGPDSSLQKQYITSAVGP